MEKREEIRQESSIPVQGRVSLIALAKMILWFENEGFRMRSISQTLGWSLELMVEVLENNGFRSGIDGVRRAREILIERGLSQKGMDKRGKMKLATAIRFEGLREEGYEPEVVDRVSYNILHNKNSIVGYRGRCVNSIVDKATEVYKEIEKRDSETVVKEKMTNEEFRVKMKEIERKDENERELMDEILYGEKDNE